MLTYLPIALAQVKAGNNSQELLNKIRQMTYSLLREKSITERAYDSIIKALPNGNDIYEFDKQQDR